MELNKENLIWERPECAKDSCNGKGFAQVGEMLICMDCFVKLEHKRAAFVKEQIEAL